MSEQPDEIIIEETPTPEPVPRRYAVTLWGENESGMPAQWEKSSRDLAEGEEPGEGEIEMSEEERAAYWAEHLPAYEAWRDSAANPSRRAETIAAIKAEAQRRIIIITGGGEYWREKQSNMIARYSELLEKVFAETITPQETAEKEALLAFWARVKAIRTFSDDLEALVNAGQAVDIEGADWPE